MERVGSMDEKGAGDSWAPLGNTQSGKEVTSSALLAEWERAYSQNTCTVTSAESGSPYPLLAVHLNWTVWLALPGRVTLRRVRTVVLDSTAAGSPTLVHSTQGSGDPVTSQVRFKSFPSVTLAYDVTLARGSTVWKNKTGPEKLKEREGDQTMAVLALGVWKAKCNLRKRTRLVHW